MAHIHIVCVSFETALVIQPLERLPTDEVHVFHYVKDADTKRGQTYQEFYEKVGKDLRSRKISFSEHGDDPIYKLEVMLREILRLADIYVEDEILININSGPREFCCAAAIASTLAHNIRLYAVPTKEYTIKPEKLHELYYENGEPVGLTRLTYDPRFVNTPDLQRPPRHLVGGLRLLVKALNDRPYLSVDDRIYLLKSHNFWVYNPEGNGKTSLVQKERMYYQRKYINEWLKLGWIRWKGDIFVLTEEGEMILSIF